MGSTSGVADRFSLETTFRDCQEVVEAEQQQVRFLRANFGAFHVCLWTFTMTEAWAWGRTAGPLGLAVATPEACRKAASLASSATGRGNPCGSTLGDHRGRDSGDGGKAAQPGGIAFIVSLKVQLRQKAAWVVWNWLLSHTMRVLRKQKNEKGAIESPRPCLHSKFNRTLYIQYIL